MVLNEKTGLYENYDLWHVPFWQTYKFQLTVKIIIGLIVLMVLFFIIKKYIYYRKRKKLSLWDQALYDLRILKEEHKVNVVYAKEFYLIISALLKKYFYNRFGYDLIGKTDDEVVIYLKDYLNQQDLEEIKTLLQGGIIIKFANAQAAQEQIEHDYLRVIELIKRTIPNKN